MIKKGRVIVVASIVTCFLIQAQGADKYTDGNRPYEFGFSIDGEQHRHEKKDEKGLIEGEFGFITADGVYHVTVYATDEQGRFKILSMKNIRVKPYPTYTAKQSSTSVRQGHSLELPGSLQTSGQPAVITTTIKPISIEPPGKSCSHCSIPTTSTPAPIGSISYQPINNSPNQIGQAEGLKLSQVAKPQSAFVSQTNNGNNPFLRKEEVNKTPQTNSQVYPGQPQNSLTGQQAPLERGLVPPQNSQSFPPQYFGSGLNSPTGTIGLQGNYPGPGSGNAVQSPRIPAYPQQSQTPSLAAVGPQSTYPGSENGQNLLNTNSAPQVPGSALYPEGGSEPVRENIATGRTPKRLDGASSFGPRGTQPNSIQGGLSSNQGAPAPLTKPTLISAQMQIVDKNTDIYRRGPGENEGLPDGLSKDDMTRLLYTFNYTVGFHGHFEEGYTNGVKQGYYFITGRNGVRTRVDYIADAKGFHPKISQEVLDLLSDDVPKPETEKDEKYGLKGYEFKWLYYPVEAKGR